MKCASRTLLSAGLLLGLLATLASGQQDYEPLMYEYSNLVQSGSLVYGYAETGLDQPLDPCYIGWNSFCWFAYTSHAQVDLYLDGFWMGGWWSDQPDGSAYAWFQNDVWVGTWDLAATHEVYDLLYEYPFSYDWIFSLLSG
jgi:hypothetical protein